MESLPWSYSDDRIRPFGRAIDELTGCHALADGDEDELVLPSLADFEVQLASINPLRGIGRDDSCPCDSSKKKCCLVR